LKNCKERNSNFVKGEVRGDSGPLDPGGRMGGDPRISEEETFREKSRREYPKSWEPKKS
jgi:hypothetical protein